MLKLFEVEGFKNFKDKITFDFSDVRDYRFNTECISNNLLGKTIVYGKNSVGKTNLGLAIFDIVTHLTTNNVDLDLYENYMCSIEFYKFMSEGIRFHYIFLFESNIIDYVYTKDLRQNLLYEKIEINSKLLFEYSFADKSGNLEALKELSPTLNLSMINMSSVLRYVVNNTVLSDDHPLRQLIQFVLKMLWFAGSDKNRFIGYKANNKDYYDFISENDNLCEFEKMLHDAGVKGNLHVCTDNDGKKRLYFTGKHDKITNSSLNMPFFSVASSGTKALYNFFYWYKTAADVSLMFIDEFDAYYHYELSETIVKILEKMSNTQVILTSHNTNLLSNRIMRPDCFFIMTERGLTSFANATDRELREGHNLEKLYMSGEFDGGK